MLEFKFPDVGEGIHEGTIVKWRVKEGDEVKSDQVLVEVETDKAIVEIPSPKAGVIGKIFHKEQQIIHVGETLVVLVDKGETYDPAAVSNASATQEKSPVQATAAPAATGDKGPGVVGSIDASNTEIAPAKVPSKNPASASTSTSQTSAPKVLPVTRMLAMKLGVDLTKISGTGANGLITDGDVRGASNTSPTTPVSTASTPVATPTPATASPKTSTPKTFSGEVTRTPYKGIRKVIGDHMVESLTRAAQVTHVDTVDVTKLVAKREAEKPLAEAKNIKLTFLAYITKAVAETLKEFPMVNSELDESDPSSPQVIIKNFYNLGIAVDTDDGLFVPTIKDADKKDIFAVAQEIVEIAEKARTKKLTAADMSGGTFTITNYGSIGGDFATPVINFPEAAILGLGKIKDAVGIDPTTRQPIVTKVMTLALTFDHRIIDGATAARFVNALGAKLQG